MLPFLPARPPHPALAAGKQFGDWELIELVGVGGFGEVWKAHHPHLPPAALKFCTNPVAVKALRNQMILDARMVRAGRHPGIVALQDTQLKHDPPYLRYEFVAGGDLTGLIQEWSRLKPEARVTPSLRVIHQLATIVGFAHALGIIHRDLKPANILLQLSSSATAGSRATFSLRVADFGIGGIASEQALQQTRLGTTPGEFLTSALRGS